MEYWDKKFRWKLDLFWLRIGAGWLFLWTKWLTYKFNASWEVTSQVKRLSAGQKNSFPWSQLSERKKKVSKYIGYWELLLRELTQTYLRMVRWNTNNAIRFVVYKRRAAGDLRYFMSIWHEPNKPEIFVAFIFFSRFLCPISILSTQYNCHTLLWPLSQIQEDRLFIFTRRENFRLEKSPYIHVAYVEWRTYRVGQKVTLHLTFNT